MHDELAWFTRATEHRVCVVLAGSELRSSVLELLPRYEFHADNRSAWVVVEDAYTHADDGWLARASRVVEHWGRRVEASAADGLVLAPVGLPRASGPGPGPLVEVVQAILVGLSGPLMGLVLVLAPTQIEALDGFERELLEFLAQTPAPGLRCVLVLDETQSWPELLGVDALAPLAVDCRVDPSQRGDDLRALLSSSEGPGFGMAGPKLEPPARIDAAPVDPAARAELLAAEGLDPKLLDAAPVLRDLALGAAIALHDGDGERAVNLQGQACAVCDELGLGELGVISRITLASYLSGLGSGDRAVVELEHAATAAEAGGHAVAGIQAQLGLGLVHALAGRRAEAVAAHLRGAALADQAEQPMFACECRRLAGQLALEHGRDAEAARHFRDAIATVEGQPAKLAAATSASEAARSLAALLRRHGSHVQAESLDAQADALEAGTEGRA